MTRYMIGHSQHRDLVRALDRATEAGVIDRELAYWGIRDSIDRLERGDGSDLDVQIAAAVYRAAQEPSSAADLVRGCLGAEL